MNEAAGTLPALIVTSRAVPQAGELLSLTDPLAPLAFTRSGDGIVGIGEALRLTFRGPDRIAEAARAWRTVAESATVDDAVGLPGSGLVAFGSFAFADDSGEESVLVVPRVIHGRRGDVSWVTTIDGAETQHPIPFGDAPSATFAPGAMTPERFESAVREVVGRIESGAVRKVVIARDVRGELDPTSDRRRLLGALAGRYPDTFTFAVDGLVGSSPETLVRVADGIATARVLAGSAARGVDARTDAAAAATIAASPKDLAEHALAVESVVASLSPHTSEIAASPAPFALELPNLWHLASDLSATLTDGSTALELVGALHPTAAVAGTPTVDALAIIRELEPFDRGRYAGPVGWVDGDGNGEWAVALRCALIDGERITAYAGAGIVAGSDPARELAETALKLAPIVDALG